MERWELMSAIDDAMLEVWGKYEESIGVDYGDVFPDILAEIEELQWRIADLMIMNFKMQEEMRRV